MFEGALDNGAPSISFEYPDSGQEVPLQSDCSFFLVADVRVDGIELVEPGEVVAGEGHWHASFDLLPGFEMAFEPFHIFEAEPGEVSPGITSQISAQLVDGGHQPIDGDQSSAFAEITIVNPDGVDCDGR